MSCASRVSPKPISIPRASPSLLRTFTSPNPLSTWDLRVTAQQVHSSYCRGFPALLSLSLSLSTSRRKTLIGTRVLEIYHRINLRGDISANTGALPISAGRGLLDCVPLSLWDTTHQQPTSHSKSSLFTMIITISFSDRCFVNRMVDDHYYV